MSDVHHWNSRYADGALPWDVGRPDMHLVRFLSAEPKPLRILEIGCGTGTNAVWMAQQGHDVTAVDLAPLAVERATERAAAAGVSVRLSVANILQDTVAGGPFDLVYDRGVFHVFDAAADRERFAAQVAAHLVEGGRWFSVAGSTEGPARDSGPPRRSLRDVAEAVEPHLEVVELAGTRFSDEEEGPGKAAAWRTLSRKRTIAAQPSTRR